MDAAAICRQLYAAGIVLSTDGETLLAAPTRALDDDLRRLIRLNKPALMRLLRDAHDTTTELLAAAMRASDFHADSDEARAEMRSEVLATPPHLRADLLAHFVAAYQPQEAPPAAQSRPLADPHSRSSDGTSADLSA